MTSTETSSLVLHGRRRASVRLRDGMVLLEADGVRRRIPVAAIERVDVHGANGRRLTIVLTGDEPVAYSGAVVPPPCTSSRRPSAVHCPYGTPTSRGRTGRVW